tara:strand:- start:245 stop:520 length:276 start_codon:yes stop_codon:yes gene_type:complete
MARYRESWITLIDRSNCGCVKIRDASKRPRTPMGDSHVRLNESSWWSTPCHGLIRPKGRIEDTRNWFDTGMIEARRFVLSHGVMGIFFMPA